MAAGDASAGGDASGATAADAVLVKPPPDDVENVRLLRLATAADVRRGEVAAPPASNMFKIITASRLCRAMSAEPVNEGGKAPSAAEAAGTAAVAAAVGEAGCMMSVTLPEHEQREY